MIQNFKRYIFGIAITLILLIFLWLFFNGYIWIFLLPLSLFIVGFTIYKTNLFQYRPIFSVPLIIITMILLAIVIRLTLFEIYIVPSRSMERTLKINDKLIVSKLVFGPRLPSTLNEIPWINFFYRKKSVKISNNSIRLMGVGALNAQDIIVFRSVQDNELFLVKRIVGLPGDLLTIKKGLLARREKYTSDKYQKQMLKENDQFVNWPLKNTPAFLVPKQNMKILLNSNNYELYEGIIKRFEGKKISSINSKYFLDGKEVKEYTFLKNYYFVLGDNQEKSIDSRYWGFLPEQLIEGKVIFHFR